MIFNLKKFQRRSVQLVSETCIKDPNTFVVTLRLASLMYQKTMEGRSISLLKFKYTTI